MAGKAYTDVTEVERLLIPTRVKIGQDEPSDTNESSISYAQVDAIRVSVESEITHRLSRFYVTPLALTSVNTLDLIRGIATKLTGYAVWLQINVNMTIDELPAAVRQWKLDADALLGQVVPNGKEVPLIGRDILLDGEGGETLLFASITPGVSAIAITRFVPYGGST